MNFMKRKNILIVILFLFVGSISLYTVKAELQKQGDEALMKKVAPEIEEFYQWNYIGVKNTKPIKVWVNSASGEREVSYQVNFTNGKKIVFDAVNPESKIDLIPLNKIGDPQIIFKVSKAGEIKDARKYLLQPSDIEILKKQGFRATISGEQIKKYLKRN